jgi:hypothetical protein
LEEDPMAKHEYCSDEYKRKEISELCDEDDYDYDYY